MRLIRVLLNVHIYKYTWFVITTSNAVALARHLRYYPYASSVLSCSRRLLVYYVIDIYKHVLLLQLLLTIHWSCIQSNCILLYWLRVIESKSSYCLIGCFHQFILHAWTTTGQNDMSYSVIILPSHTHTNTCTHTHAHTHTYMHARTYIHKNFSCNC